MSPCAVEQWNGQDLINNNLLPIEIIGVHALKDVEHLIHGIEHHVGMHPSPLVTGYTHLMIICRHLKVGNTFIYMPPKILTVPAKCGVEAPLKDGVKPVNENQII